MLLAASTSGKISKVMAIAATESRKFTIREKPCGVLPSRSGLVGPVTCDLLASVPPLPVKATHGFGEVLTGQEGGVPGSHVVQSGLYFPAVAKIGDILHALDGQRWVGCNSRRHIHAPADAPAITAAITGLTQVCTEATACCILAVVRRTSARWPAFFPFPCISAAKTGSMVIRFRP